MLHAEDIKRLGLLLVKQAEVEGMKADNQFCQIHKKPPCFVDSDFQEKADEIRNIVYAHGDQL